MYGAAVPYQVNSVVTPATNVTLQATPASPTGLTAAVTFTADGTGSTTNGAPTPAIGYSYQFWMNDGTGWVIVQPYSTTATFGPWTPPAVGTYTFAVWVRTTPALEADVYGSPLPHVVQ